MHRAGLFLIAISLAGPAAAQSRLSERATVSQTVNGTVISVDYARPRVRGRSPIFGNRVHWGEVWTPGANMATTLEVSRDVELDGHPVGRGKYSVWFVVAEGEEWTLLLDENWGRFHTDRPGARDGRVRFAVRAAPGPATEVLTFSFPEISETGTVLQFQWDERVVRIAVSVRPAASVPGTAAP